MSALQEKCSMLFAQMRLNAIWKTTVFCLLATFVWAAQSGDFIYTINPNGTVRIDEYTGLGGNVAIPSALNGRTVVGIGRYAFSASTNLAGIIIPDSVLYLEDYVFNDCTALTSVAIGVGLNSIGFGVFNYCRALTAINVHPGNSTFSSIAGVLFSKSQKTLLQYPEGRVGAYTVPAGVTNIGRRAFMDCARLSGIVLPAGLIGVDEAAFWGCTGLPGITLPDGLANIAADAFWGCSGMANVTFPGSVTNIGNHAFYECAALSSVNLPASVASIGAWAFGRCANLTSIAVDNRNAFYSSLNGVLLNKDQTVLVQYPGGKSGTYSVPGSVISIGGDPSLYNEGLGGFAYCAGLTGIVMQNRVVELGNNAFRACIGLRSLTLPDSIAVVGHSVFAYCANLTSVALPDRLEQIPFTAFVGCTGLTRIVIPDNVAEIGAGAFASCTGLSRAIIGSGVVSIGESAFWKCENLMGVYFWGNAPVVAGTNIFDYAENATVYYLYGAAGWEATFANRPTALWSPSPLPKIRANNQRGTVTIARGQPLAITLTMAAGGYYNVNVDWWVLIIPHAGQRWYYLNSAFTWASCTAGDMAGLQPALQAPLVNVPVPATVLQINSLLPGRYAFCFAIDQMDGILNYPDGPIILDAVQALVE